MKGHKYQKDLSHINMQENAHFDAWVWRNENGTQLNSICKTKRKNMNKLQHLTQKWSLVFEDKEGCFAHKHINIERACLQSQQTAVNGLSGSSRLLVSNLFLSLKTLVNSHCLRRLAGLIISWWYQKGSKCFSIFFNTLNVSLFLC